MHIFSSNPPQLADYGVIHILAIWISLYIPCLFWDHVNQTSWYVWKLGSFLSINQSSCSSEVIPAFLNFVLVAICIPIFSRVDKRAWANACSPVDTFGDTIFSNLLTVKKNHTYPIVHLLQPKSIQLSLCWFHWNNWHFGEYHLDALQWQDHSLFWPSSLRI